MEANEILREEELIGKYDRVVIVKQFHRKHLYKINAFQGFKKTNIGEYNSLESCEEALKKLKDQNGQA